MYSWKKSGFLTYFSVFVQNIIPRTFICNMAKHSSIEWDGEELQEVAGSGNGQGMGLRVLSG